MRAWGPEVLGSYNSSVIQYFRACLMAAVVVAASTLSAQTPQPFPRPNTPSTQKPPAPVAPQAPLAPQAPSSGAASGAPTEAMLGAPLYPSAVYLTSYDAGRGQRFYLFGVSVPYAELVAYYKTVLKQKGDG